MFIATNLEALAEEDDEEFDDMTEDSVSEVSLNLFLEPIGSKFIISNARNTRFYTLAVFTN